MFLSEWREFPSAPCLAGGKNIWWQLASRCCWNSSRRLICFLSAYVTRKDFQFVTWTPLSKDTIYSALRHREVSRAKYLSAPPLMLSVNFCVQVEFKVMPVEKAYFLYVLCSKLEQLCHTPNSNILYIHSYLCSCTFRYETNTEVIQTKFQLLFTNSILFVGDNSAFSSLSSKENTTAVNKISNYTNSFDHKNLHPGIP